MAKLRALDFRTEPFAPRFYDSDPGGDPAGAVVMLHGTFGSTASHFGLVFPELAQHRRVIGLDFQPVAEELELADLVEQTHNLMAGLGLVRPHVLGYSLGAVVAAQFAADHSDNIGQLVLLAGWLCTDRQQELRNDLWFQLFDSDELALRRYTALSVFGPEFLAGMSERQLKITVEGPRYTEFGAAQMRLNRRIDISQAAERITAETLVLACSQDAMVPFHHQEQLVATVPDAHLEVLAGGHGIVFEDPDAIVRSVSDFLD